jgi:hypothetical protein
MDQPASQRGIQPAGDLCADFEDLHLGNAALQCHQVVERAFVHEFHRDVDDSMVRARGKDLHHVGVIDRGSNRRLALKLRDEFRVRAVLLAEQFQRDEAV